MNEKNERFTVADLEIQKKELENRIKGLVSDLKEPYSSKFDEQALQISNNIFLKRLLEVERANLRKLNFEIDKKLRQLEISGP